MTPTQPPTPATPAPAPLKGTATTIGGYASLISGIAVLFAHIWGAAHGGTLDPTTLTTGGGLLAAGITGIKAADAKQPPSTTKTT